MARVTALENRRLARSGGDPLAEKRKAEAALRLSQNIPTFSEAIDGCLEVLGPEFTSAIYRKQWRAALCQHAVPLLGKLPVDQIDANDVLAVLKPIWIEKTETARRLRRRIEAVLRWATSEGYREGENPARWKDNLEGRLPRPGKVAKSAHYPAVQLSELPDWWSDLHQRDGRAARALEFLALTAVRSGEVRGMTWGEVDLDERNWIVPPARTKTKREHRVPLSNAAHKALSALARMDGSEIVFPAPMGGMLSDMSISAVMRRMHAAAVKSGGTGYLDRQSERPAVPHGLRSSFRDWVAERTSYPGEMAEVALAHKISNSVEAAYRRGDQMEKRRHMMEAWAQFLEGMGGSDVIPIKMVRI